MSKITNEKCSILVDRYHSPMFQPDGLSLVFATTITATHTANSDSNSTPGGYGG